MQLNAAVRFRTFFATSLKGVITVA